MATAPSLHVTTEQIQFFQKLYSGMPSPIVELSTIEGDPQNRRTSKWRQGWTTCQNPRVLAEQVNAHAARDLNVYCSVSGYREQSRGAETYPSPILFVDDAPEHGPLAWSMYVKTSPTSGQGYIILDAAVDAAERVRLARRIAATVGGDPSGVDTQQLVRPPGSINGKPHAAGYRAWLKVSSSRKYTVAEVEAATKEGAAPARATAEAPEPASIDWDGAAVVLANIDQVINPENKIPWHIHNHSCSQTYKILANQQQWPKKEGSGDDASRIRWHVAEGLLRFFGYSDTLLAGILLFYRNFEHLGADSSKGTAEIKVDIARIVGKLRTLHPTVAPRSDIVIAPTNAAQPIPELPRKRKGRRLVITPDEYYDWLTANADDGTVQQTRPEIATQLNISIPTVDRLELQLRARGLTQRHTSKDRRRSWITLLGTIKNAEQDVVSPLETAPPVLSQAPRIEDARTQEREHTAPQGLPPIPHASTPVIREALTVLPVDASEWAQERIGPLPRRRRVADRTPDEQVQALKAQLGKVRARKRRQKRLGVDAFSLAGLERAAAKIQAQLTEVEAAQSPPDLSPMGDMPPDAVQLAIDDAETVLELPYVAQPDERPGNVSECAPSAAVCSPFFERVSVPLPRVPLIDLDNAPGILAGKIAPDDPWLALQRQMQATQGVRP